MYRYIIMVFPLYQLLALCSLFYFIADHNMEQNNPVLVFCKNGISRAATVIIAYLMFSQKITLEVGWRMMMMMMMMTTTTKTT
jgi:protein-tyrosine phosphatase